MVVIKFNDDGWGADPRYWLADVILVGGLVVA